ncbi:hypothetical protein JCGZ_06975 [Jatropha curcas]|uniref:Uncharacterized protein n=1 Tax=Jatropha curcas TaxID=180498 RepID=A0A067KNL4_JATCU|nr:hypothetical protein JCGZ_06975 [Jatropha curcas]
MDSLVNFESDGMIVVQFWASTTSRPSWMATTAAVRRLSGDASRGRIISSSSDRGIVVRFSTVEPTGASRQAGSGKGLHSGLLRPKGYTYDFGARKHRFRMAGK